jgi:hypothetical protein
VDFPHTPLSRPWHALTYPHAPPSSELFIGHLLAHGGPAPWEQPPAAALGSPPEPAGQRPARHGGPDHRMFPGVT